MNAGNKLNTCKSNGNMEAASDDDGAQVRNAYATYLLQRMAKKFGLTPHSITLASIGKLKLQVVKDGHAFIAS